MPAGGTAPHGDARAVAREVIDVRRARIRMPVAMQVAAAEVIGEEEDDVGAFRIGGGEGCALKE